MPWSPGVLDYRLSTAAERNTGVKGGWNQEGQSTEVVSANYNPGNQVRATWSWSFESPVHLQALTARWTLASAINGSSHEDRRLERFEKKEKQKGLKKMEEEIFVSPTSSTFRWDRDPLALY